jgi:hypothetical protein
MLRGIWRGCGLAVCVAWASALASVGAAQSVVLVRPDAQDSELLDVYHRLQGELRIHHFEAFEVDAAALASDALPQLAEAHDAVAALALARESDRVTLQVGLAKTSGQRGVRTLAAERSDDAASLIALRAVDLLRVTLGELAQPPPTVTAPPPTAAEREPPASAPKFWLSASGLMLRLGERFGFGFGPLLGFDYVATSWIRIGIRLAGPIAGARLSTDSGDATLYQELAWLELRAVLLRAGALQLGALLGAGVYFVQALGDAKSPLTSRNDQVSSALVNAGAHVSIELSRHVSLGVSVRALALLPRTGIAVYSESALIDLPALEASFGIAVGL